MNSSRFISAVLFGLACYLGSFSAFANEQAIEEIIVTARQQSEGLQDVPVTIAALTEEDLDRYNINNLDDAGKMVQLAQDITQRLNAISWNDNYFTHMIPENEGVERDLGEMLAAGGAGGLGGHRHELGGECLVHQ